MSEADKSALFDQLFKTLSPYHISAANLNTAGQAVLDYITGDPSESLAIINYRNGSDGRPNTEDDRAFTSVDEVLRYGIQTKQAYSLEAGPFIVHIRIKDAARSFALTGFLFRIHPTRVHCYVLNTAPNIYNFSIAFTAKKNID